MNGLVLSNPVVRIGGEIRMKKARTRRAFFILASPRGFEPRLSP
jgi:hypothetical protein